MSDTGNTLPTRAQVLLALADSVGMLDDCALVVVSIEPAEGGGYRSATHVHAAAGLCRRHTGIALVRQAAAVASIAADILTGGGDTVDSDDLAAQLDDTDEEEALPS